MKDDALRYHKSRPAGKLETVPTKKVDSEWDLSLAYSPGVAEPCKEIHRDKDLVFDYTGRGNLVAVVTNGSAVLGLGAIGPLASKPVMEGKAVLFKKFAGINVFDVEINSRDPKEIISFCKNLEPTVGGINLEDISAPACFEVETALKKELNIPVFHDDQHGTAIITTAALLNACYLQNKKVEDVRVVFSGAGAAALSCARLIQAFGVKKSRIILCDSLGVVYKGRTQRMNPYKEEFAVKTQLRSLEDALSGADVFIGLSVKNILTEKMIQTMSDKPVIFAMANPDPEISPEKAKKANPRAIVATGRSDYPNQVNNVLGFPFIFRGALDVRAKAINEEMKRAAVNALSALARKSVPDSVLKAYEEDTFQFGPDYIIPKPFDPRVLLTVAPAVAKAAMDSGVAGRPIKDFQKYIHRLETFQSESRGFIRTAINRVRAGNQLSPPPVVLFPEGTAPRILKALNTLIPEKIMEPVLMGEEKDIKDLIKQHNLPQLKKVKIIHPEGEGNLQRYAEEFYRMKKHKGMTRDKAKQLLQEPNYYSAMAIHSGDFDALITGATDSFRNSVIPVLRVVGTGKRNILAGVNLVLLKNRVLFFADTAVNINPTAQEIAHIAVYTAQTARYFNIKPRVALLSFVSFSEGREDNPKKMRQAVEIVRKQHPDLQIEGEVQADIAVNEDIAREIFPSFSYKEGANVLIFPNLDSGNIAYKLVQQLGSGEVIGPLLMGIKKPVNILQRTCSVEDVINSSVLTALKVHAYRDREEKSSRKQSKS